MRALADRFLAGFVGYAHWLAAGARSQSGRSYLVLLVVATLAALALERLRPWRTAPHTRRFGRGTAYLVLNFFGFNLLGFAAFSGVAEDATRAAFAALGLADLAIVRFARMPFALEVAAYLVARDFVEYWIHRLLHRVPWLWRIHRVHHSVRDLDVFAHLTFHPLETVVYRTLEFLPLAMLGFSLRDFFVAHAIALVVGHLNHANLRVPLGPLRYVLNSAPMHLLHHAKTIPSRYGVNYGLTLSIWDFLLGTAVLPDAIDPETELGFAGVEKYPTSLGGALVEPFRADVMRAPQGDGMGAG